MKKKIILSIFTLISANALMAQQWTTNGINIYNNNSGKVGIGTGAAVPFTKLEVRDGNYSEIMAFTTANKPATVWVANNHTNYGFNNDENGIGRIVQDRNTPQGHIKLINFFWNTTLPTPAPQVWVGERKPAAWSSHPDFRFAVEGKLVAKEVIIFQNNWSDFVFDEDYKLTPLNEVEEYYKTNHHLPNIPNTKEIIEKGNDLGKTDALLLQKIEELTLYVVELQKEVEKLKDK